MTANDKNIQPNIEIRCDLACQTGGGLYCESHAVSVRSKQDCVCDDGQPIRCPAGQWQENTRRAHLELEQARDDSGAQEAFDKIAELCGCPEWEYPGQLVRDVEALKADRDLQYEQRRRLAGHLLELAAERDRRSAALRAIYADASRWLGPQRDGTPRRDIRGLCTANGLDPEALKEEGK